MKKSVFAGLFLGVSLVSGAALADAPTSAPFIQQIEFHNDMHAGALWQNNNPQNYDQHGAGCEHGAITYLAAAQRILYTCTASYTDITPAVTTFTTGVAPLSSQAAYVLDPTDAGADGIGVREDGNSRRVQALCASYQYDPVAGLKLVNSGYFTNNNNNDWKNGHKQAVYSIYNGAAAIAFFGYNPNNPNNTATYAHVLGPSCEILTNNNGQTGVQGGQTLLVAKTNDDVGGLYEGGVSRTRTDGNWEVIFGMIGNGNGLDNGWIAKAKVVANTDGTYSVSKVFDQTVVQNEERSRGTIIETTNPNEVLVIYAEGNAQPPNDGLRASRVDVEDTYAGANPDQGDGGRIIWRQYLMQRQGNIYYTTPSMVPIRDSSGNVTDNFIANYVMVDTSNRNGRNKGRTQSQTVPITISETGVTMTDQPQAGLFGLADNSHPGMVEGTYGTTNQPVSFLFDASIEDGGQATVKIVGMDSSNHLSPIRALNWADTTSGGFTSQWYGENPNTAQGRTYPPHGLLWTNPGYGQAGGFQSSVSQFLIVEHAYHENHSGECPAGSTDNSATNGTDNGTCGGKNAAGLVMIPVNADAAPSTGSNDPVPTNPDPINPTAGGSSQTLGGCSTTGTAGGAGSLVLLGMALASVRRRRSN